MEQERQGKVKHTVVAHGGSVVGDLVRPPAENKLDE